MRPDDPPPLVADIASLVEEVYGQDAAQFLGTPRRSLGGRTPLRALEDGDADMVREVLLGAALGDWS